MAAFVLVQASLSAADCAQADVAAPKKASSESMGRNRRTFSPQKPQPSTDASTSSHIGKTWVVGPFDFLGLFGLPPRYAILAVCRNMLLFGLGRSGPAASNWDLPLKSPFRAKSRVPGGFIRPWQKPKPRPIG